MNHTDDLVFLRSDVKLEPLVCRFYAWPHLVAPAQLAMNVAFRILPLLESFEANPAVHVAANQDPEMFGGPFVCLTEADLPAVRALIASIRERCGDLVDLANAIKAFDITLQGSATGNAMGEHYAQLPGPLRGVTELLYDTHQHPILRLFEGFLYQDQMGAPTQEVRLSLDTEGARTFFMSTPRLDTPESLCLPLRFADKRLDELAAMRTVPGSFQGICKALDLDDEQRAAFRQFFTPQGHALAADRDYDGPGVRVRYFGHACVLVQSREVSVLFDPMLAFEHKGDGRYTFHDLPDHIDYVVLSHGHQDHVCPEMLVQIRHRVGQVIVPANNSGHIADPSLKLILEEMGYHDVQVMEPFDQLALPGGEMVSLPFTGEHSDLAIYAKQSLVLRLAGAQFMFLVDSDGRDAAMYRRITARFGAVDALFLGMECDGAPLNWLYEPVLTRPISRRHNEARRLSGADCERAWNVIQEIRTPRVFIYAMGQEPWLRYLMGLEYTAQSPQLIESNRFIEQCNGAGIEARRLYLSHQAVYGGPDGQPRSAVQASASEEVA